MRGIIMEYSLPILPTISTAFIVLSAVTVAIGWNLIRQRKIEAHKKTMMLAALFALIFFIIYASRTIFIGNTSFGGPENIKIYYTIFLIFHITLATVGAVLGIIMLVTGFQSKFSVHRKIGPTTSIIWFFTGITGVAVYFLLYVIYHGGETTSVIKAILGN
jgi:putative membrane protein